MDNAKDIDVVMLLYNLIEYINNYWKTWGSLWQYYRNELFLDDNGDVVNFPAANNNSALFKFKHKITGKTGNDGTEDAEITASLKILSNVWRILEIL